MQDILIIGGGTAGLTAAIYARRAGLSCTVFEGGTPGGKIVASPEVANYPAMPKVSGFDYAKDDLFDGASFILTPTRETDPAAVETLRALALDLGFGKAVVSTPEEHDRIIAATSQLAHIVSNAYIKSPTLRHQAGFSAGSYQDLTRVAKLSEEMWTSLFLLNREALLFEVETIIGHLSQYRDALAAGNAPELKELLREGRILKEEDIERTAVRNQK